MKIDFIKQVPKFGGNERSVTPVVNTNLKWQEQLFDITNIPCLKNKIKFIKKESSAFNVLSKSSVLYVNKFCGLPLSIIIKIPTNTFLLEINYQISEY